MAIGCVLCSILYVKMLSAALPDHLTIASDTEQTDVLEQMIPEYVGKKVQKSVEASASGASDIPKGDIRLCREESYTVECSLFGIFPVKEIQVDVVERQELIPGGIPVGIYMKTEGVLIVGTGEVCAMDGTIQEPVGDIVRSGDYILAVNHVPVTEKEEVTQQIHEAAEGKVELQVLRGEQIIELQVPVVQADDGAYKAGIWVRDDTQGIGTLTFVDEQGNFGALGHGISDIDTSTLLTLRSGHLYAADIRSVIRGEQGVPGALSGVIRYQKDQVLGSIERNTSLGIFGTLTTELPLLQQKSAKKVAYRQEIEPGPATLLCAVDGALREYQIEIEKINLNSYDANKSMMIRVTDPGLLELTGGIVQGMSGSPILQKDRIVGAVTHVFVDDPTKGYAIFIEEML